MYTTLLPIRSKENQVYGLSVIVRFLLLLVLLKQESAVFPLHILDNQNKGERWGTGGEGLSVVFPLYILDNLDNGERWV